MKRMYMFKMSNDNFNYIWLDLDMIVSVTTLGEESCIITMSNALNVQVRAASKDVIELICARS